jgi:hypothetical protein
LHASALAGVQPAVSRNFVFALVMAIRYRCLRLLIVLPPGFGFVVMFAGERRRQPVGDRCPRQLERAGDKFQRTDGWVVHGDRHMTRVGLRMAKQFVHRLHRAARDPFFSEKALPFGARPPLDFFIQPPV